MASQIGIQPLFDAMNEKYANERRVPSGHSCPYLFECVLCCRELH